LRIRENKAMIFPKLPSLALALRSLTVGAMTTAALGCGRDEEITRTTEPRVDYAKNEQSKSEKKPTRILGGIAPRADEGSWFFKLMGPTEEVSKQETAFDAFLASIQFVDGGDKPVTWTLPEGWRNGPPRGRYATILMGPADDPLELTVMSAGGSLLENVNRWRDQVSLPRVKSEDLGTASREITTKQGKKLTRVDASGMASKGAQMPPFMKGR
jgi:hypothetical protein